MQTQLFVATPMYGGSCNGQYTGYCLSLQQLMISKNIPVVFSFVFNESLVQRGRNYLAHEFLKTECTHLLFIDADIVFNPSDVYTLMTLDKDVIGAPYSKKCINWGNISNAVKNFPDLQPKEYENFAGMCVFNTLESSFRVDEPQDVLEIGAGFMLIKRKVFLEMKLSFPELYFKSDIDYQNSTGNSHGTYMFAFFHTIIDSKNGILEGGSERYLSEDYFFCQLWRKLGGKIFICPWMKTLHVGTYSFTCDIPSIATIETVMRVKEESKS